MSLKMYGEFGRDKNLVSCRGYNAPTLCFKSTEEVFSVQGTWHYDSCPGLVTVQ